MASAKIYRIDGGMVLIDEVENVDPEYNEDDYIRECREDAENNKTEEKMEWLEYIEEKQIVVEVRLSTDAQIRAAAKYSKNNVKQVKIGLNKKTDSDIIAKLEEVPNTAGYIKKLIREDMK